VLVAVRHTWGEDRVFFVDEEGTQRSLPRAWTDAADLEPFVVLAGGRSPVRVEDLLALVELIDGLRPRGTSRGLSGRLCRDCQGDFADAALSDGCVLPGRGAHPGDGRASATCGGLLRPIVSA